MATFEPVLKITEEKKHARLSPSGTKRWMTCAGSVQLCEQLNPNGERRTSRFAAEGTVAHEVGDKCLTNKKHPSAYLGRKMMADGFEFTVTQEMVDAVEQYVDYVNTQAEEFDTFVEAEVWGDLKFLKVAGLDGGTTDALLISHKHKLIVVIDYKHGQGVAVDVEENPQLMCYGMGALGRLKEELDNTIPAGKNWLAGWTVKLVIVQPRAYHPDGRIREWEIPAEELSEWAWNDLKNAGELCLSENPPLQASDEGCRFCDAAGDCPELEQRTQELAVVDFEDIMVEPDEKFPPLPTLTPLQKINIMEHAEAIKAFVTAVENSIKIDMEHGSEEYNSHFKLVRKGTHRKLDAVCSDEICSPLLDVIPEDKVFVTKMKALTDIERAVKKELGTKEGKVFIDDYITKPEGAVVVAKISDKRKAIEPSAKRDFAGMEDD